MFVSKKKYISLLARYEQVASRADQLAQQLMELDRSALDNGGPYKRILECREAALAVSQPGSEEQGLTLHRLAFIDRWLTSMVPILTKRMPAIERKMWEDALKYRSASMAYGTTDSQPEGDRE
ncbi:Uncharacterised protein [Serratia quinivorans]|uniref:hypothetical protein n=1 Tax=Serratia TaxID=613 RepID=UPI001F4BE95C|nr:MULTISPECIES: hypothetical protein [Serratia]ULG12058.1 hypothetical protein D1p1_00025 [Serratia entomophila]ULG12423.1 hypothetical protein M3p_00132 [Serratia entomophila]ULG15001.1 hypothetical protein 149p2_00025 [Serratia proteamaculans]ULG15892.1 hypothetical protein 591p_00040 [Serratia proteamaculans]ULG18371.1 hypothetical protein Man4p_00053 [Serratia proteamaculans]